MFYTLFIPGIIFKWFLNLTVHLNLRISNLRGKKWFLYEFNPTNVMFSSITQKIISFFPHTLWNINIKSPLHIIAEYCLFGFKNLSVSSRVDPCPKPLPCFLHACGSICWEQLWGQSQGELTPCCPEPFREWDKMGVMGQSWRLEALGQLQGPFCLQASHSCV